MVLVGPVGQLSASWLATSAANKNLKFKTRAKVSQNLKFFSKNQIFMSYLGKVYRYLIYFWYTGRWNFWKNIQILQILYSKSCKKYFSLKFKTMLCSSFSSDSQTKFSSNFMPNQILHKFPFVVGHLPTKKNCDFFLHFFRIFFLIYVSDLTQNCLGKALRQKNIFGCIIGQFPGHLLFFSDNLKKKLTKISVLFWKKVQLFFQTTG